MSKGVTINLEQLRGAIYGKGLEVAEKLNISRVNLSNKIRGKVPMTLDELNMIAKHLKRNTLDFLVETDLADYNPTFKRRSATKKRDHCQKEMIQIIVVS
jgi:transcriptional regulator with XRE-family HTH domain